MRLETFGSYTLPPTKVDTVSFDTAMGDDFETADELPGSIPLMGMDGTLIAEAVISVTHIIGRSFMQGAYDINEGGLDTALHDFRVNVFGGGIQTLTIIPNPGTRSWAGGAGGEIDHWTCDAEAAKQRSTHLHPGGAMVQAEVAMVYLIHSTGLTAHLKLGGTVWVPL